MMSLFAKLEEELYSYPGLPHTTRHVTSSQGFDKLDIDHPASKVFQPKLKQSFISASSPFTDIAFMTENPENFHRYRDMKTRPSTYPQWKPSLDASRWPMDHNQVNPLDDSPSSCHLQNLHPQYDQGQEIATPSGSQVSLGARCGGPNSRQTTDNQSAQPDLEEMSRNLTCMVINEPAPEVRSTEVTEEHPKIIARVKEFCGLKRKSKEGEDSAVPSKMKMLFHLGKRFVSKRKRKDNESKIPEKKRKL